MQHALHIHKLTKSQAAHKIYNTHRRHKKVKGKNNMSHCTKIKFTQCHV